MNDLQEEIAASDQRDKRRNILKRSVVGIAVFLLLSTLISFAVLQSSANQSIGSTQNYDDTTMQESVPIEIEPTESIADQSSYAPLPPPETSQQSEDAAMAALQAQMDHENKVLRQQWVADAYSVSADMAKMGTLIGKGDATSLEQAKQLDSATTRRTGILGILQGMPDAHESQLKQSAATDATNAIVKYADALGWMEACKKHNFTESCWTARQKLNEATSINQSLSGKIQGVELYMK